MTTMAAMMLDSDARTAEMPFDEAVATLKEQGEWWVDGIANEGLYCECYWIVNWGTNWVSAYEDGLVTRRALFIDGELSLLQYYNDAGELVREFEA